jgi:hypothetical protein
MSISLQEFRGQVLAARGQQDLVAGLLAFPDEVVEEMDMRRAQDVDEELQAPDSTPLVKPDVPVHRIAGVKTFSKL